MLLFTAATKKPSPRAPVVSEGVNPSRSSIPSNPVTRLGARALERSAASGSAAPGRDLCENVSNEVGGPCDSAVTRPCTTARDAVRERGLADRSADADGTSSNPTPATRTVRTASTLRDVRIRGLPLVPWLVRAQHPTRTAPVPRPLGRVRVGYGSPAQRCPGGRRSGEGPARSRIVRTLGRGLRACTGVDRAPGRRVHAGRRLPGARGRGTRHPAGERRAFRALGALLLRRRRSRRDGRARPGRAPGAGRGRPAEGRGTERRRRAGRPGRTRRVAPGAAGPRPPLAHRRADGLPLVRGGGTAGRAPVSGRRHDRTADRADAGGPRGRVRPLAATPTPGRAHRPRRLRRRRGGPGGPRLPALFPGRPVAGPSARDRGRGRPARRAAHAPRPP